MNLSSLDITIVISFFVITFLIGMSVAHSAGKNKEEFFLGGRSMPWWLLGFSMVATTFSVDTPALVTNMVRSGGISANWSWWAMLPGGMLTAFIYAKLWRRSEALTDIEFYELRYSGKLAVFLRKFRTIFIGLLFSIITIAGVTMALIKVGATMLHLSPLETIIFAMGLTAIFSAAGGLKGVLFSDMVLFILAMVASVSAAYFVVNLPEIGGISNLLNQLSSDPENAHKISLMGFGSQTDFIAFFLVPISLVWWSVWYPGAEPGGGSFIAQRMLAAKNETHAIKATLFFNILHYGVRPWPWLLVALGSLVLYPNMETLKAHLTGVLPEHQIGGDAAYALMMTKLPHGWLGLMVASMAAAYISTLSTLLNLASGYFVNDLYVRFINPIASPKKQVLMGRVVTISIAVIGGIVALYLSNALDLFQFLLSFGAGTGLIYMLRWFWWRINALSELVAIISAFLLSLYFTFIHQYLFPYLPLSWSMSLVIQTLLVTIMWIIAAYYGPQTDKQVLIKFYKKTRPAGCGWAYIQKQLPLNQRKAKNSSLNPIFQDILLALSATGMIYAVLFGTGYLIYQDWIKGTIALFLLLVFAIITIKQWRQSSYGSHNEKYS